MPAAFTESAWRAYPHYGRSSTMHTEEDGSHDGQSVWKTLGKSFLLQGRPRASLSEISTHSTLTLSPYFKATAGGEGSGSINPLVVDQLMLILTKNISEQDEVIDIIMCQRRKRNEQIEGGQDGFPNSNTPSQMIVSPIASLSRPFCFMTLPASVLFHASSHAGSSTDDGVRGVPKGLDSPMGTTRCRRSPGTVPERVNTLARVQGAA